MLSSHLRYGFVLAVCLVGCRADVTTTDEVGSEIETTDQELIPFVGQDVLAAKVEAFRARNGEDWEAARRESWKALLPGVMNMVRRSAPSAGNIVPSAEQQGRALAFVRANLDLLGIDPSIELKTQPVVGYVHIQSNRRAFPGLEADYRVKNDVSVSVALSSDGSIRHVFQLQRFPRPTLSTTPVHAATDPVIANGLVGKTLYYGNHSFSEITQGDLANTQIVAHVEERPTGLLLTLAHRIRISRDDAETVCPPIPWVSWELVVDTRDGKVLDGGTETECFGW